MFPRSLVTPQTLSFFLFGARGTGKSTWLQQNFAIDQHLWIDLTDPQVERRYARRPEILLDEWKAIPASRSPDPNSRPWIIVDEVQKIPAILDVAHVGIQRHAIRFALTGSSARKLKRGTANLLGGRALSCHMYPLTSTELGDAFELDRYLTWGGLPMAQSIKDPRERQGYLRSYVDTYLREEIQIEQLVRKIEPFRMFLDIVGQMNGQVINMASIAREADIDAKSAERYFQILADTLIGFFLPAWDRSIRKSQLRHPKFFLFDVGVARAVRRELTLALEPHTGAYGHAFEHFMIQEIQTINSYEAKDFRLSYLRTKDDAEVDLVIERPSRRPLFVEIKSTDRPEIVETRRLKALAADAKADCVVLCRTKRPVKIDGVMFQPWQEGLKDIFA